MESINPLTLWTFRRTHIDPFEDSDTQRTMYNKPHGLEQFNIHSQTALLTMCRKTQTPF